MDIEEKKLKNTLAYQSKEFDKALRNLIFEIGYALKLDKILKFLTRILLKWI